jgi:hypothetical protein
MTVHYIEHQITKHDWLLYGHTDSAFSRLIQYKLKDIKHALSNLFAEKLIGKGPQCVDCKIKTEFYPHAGWKMTASADIRPVHTMNMVRAAPIDPRPYWPELYKPKRGFRKLLADLVKPITYDGPYKKESI